MTLLIPLWHLRAQAAQQPQTQHDNPWRTLAALLPFPDGAPPWVGAPWSLVLGPVDFVDPLATAGVFAAGQGSVAVLLACMPVLLLIALLGRFFCGWLCPYIPLLAAANATRALIARLGLSSTLGS